MDSRKLEIRNKAAEQKRQWVRLVNACNQKCIFCHDRERQYGGIVPFARIIKELKRGRQRGCARVVLSGGEPTLHPQLARIIAKAKSLGYAHVQVVSNGRMFFYEDFVKKVKAAGLDEVTLSLHSHLKGPFERISQVKGSYWQAMRGLLNVLKNDLIVSVDIVINKINYRTLDDTLKFFMALGVTEFDLLHLIPFGDAWKNRKDTYYSMARAKKYLDKAFDLSRRSEIHLWTNRLPAIYLEGYEELIQNPRKLEDEISDMEHDLKSFIKAGRTMSCFGDRCPDCFMHDFCKDLAALRTKKILFARKPPQCLRKKSNNHSTCYRFRRNMDIYKFLNFFIESRYFVKSLRCQHCKLDSECDGVPINEIRSRGFKVLTPL